MVIKLIAPRMSLRPMDSQYKRVLSPSLALITLAALAAPEDRVEIEDENVKKLDFSDNVDLVGITVNVDTSKRAYEIADAYRSRGIPVILGGIHPSANPEEALRHADAVCVGDVEGVWSKILKDARKGAMAGIYKSGNLIDLEPFRFQSGNLSIRQTISTRTSCMRAAVARSLATFAITAAAICVRRIAIVLSLMLLLKSRS